MSVSRLVYLLLVVFDSEPQTGQSGYTLLKRLLVQGILTLVAAAVQDCGNLALVAAHPQQLHGKLLTELLKAQVFRLQGRSATVELDTQHEQ